MCKIFCKLPWKLKWNVARCICRESSSSLNSRREAGRWTAENDFCIFPPKFAFTNQNSSRVSCQHRPLCLSPLILCSFLFLSLYFSLSLSLSGRSLLTHVPGDEEKSFHIKREREGDGETRPAKVSPSTIVWTAPRRELLGVQRKRLEKTAGACDRVCVHWDVWKYGGRSETQDRFSLCLSLFLSRCVHLVCRRQTEDPSLTGIQMSIVGPREWDNGSAEG